MSGYVNTRLIDCNRLNSAEHRQGNKDKSIWTSKVGSGIKLDVGDKVSVHSSFISELGCGNNDVIETTGQVLGKRKFNYTEYNYPDPYKYPLNSFTNQNTLPNGYTSRDAKNQDIEIEVKDNDFNIVVSYYKNTNGEQHIHLPRRFDKFKYTREGGRGANEYWRANEYRNEDSYNNGNITDIPSIESRVDKDWMYTRTPTYGVVAQPEGYPANNLAEIYSVGAPDWNNYTPGAKDGTSLKGDGKGKGYIRATDNSRYTIYVMDKSFWSPSAVNIEEFPLQTNSEDSGLTGERDIALVNYIKYKELKSYSIKEGFNSPANIGTALTAELQNVKRLETKKIYMGVISTESDIRRYPSRPTPDPHANEYGGPGLYQPEVSLSIESDTYKLIDAACWYTLSKDNYDSWNDATYPATAEQLRNSVLYYSAYSMIGVKRPDLFEAMRELNASNFDEFDQYDGDDWFTFQGIQEVNADGSLQPVQTTIQSDDNTYPDQYPFDKTLLLRTDIPYTRDNMDRIKKIFDAQHKYPELFDYRFNGSVLPEGGSRFIHFDAATTTELPLGYDGYEVYDQGSTATIGLPSEVIFVDCVEDLKNIYNEGNDHKNLSYGFGCKYTKNFIDYIAFSCQSVPMTNREIFLASSSTFINAGGRKLGFDWHFNAYGTDCILPYTGITETDVDNRSLTALYNYDQPWYNPTIIPNGTSVADSVNLIAHRCVNPGDVGSGLYDYTATWGAQKANIIDFSWAIRHIYCGAIDPLINFDTDTSRFEISQLHTAESYGNQFLSGAPAKVVSGWQGLLVPLSDNGTTASTKVYKINKQVQPFLYTPDIAPYFTEMELPNTKCGVQVKAAQVDNPEGIFEAPYSTANPSPAGVPPNTKRGFAGVYQATTETTHPENFRYRGSSNLFTLTNTKIKLWNIFDSECGIYIEDFGTDSQWSDDSLLGIMGFEYNQMDPTNKTGNSQTRLSKNTMDEIFPVTTNALITPLDTKILNQNMWGTPMPSNPSMPYSVMTNIYADTIPNTNPANDPYPYRGSMNYNESREIINNEIIGTQVSAVFRANLLPKKMTIPYYLICSNLINDKFYNGNTDGNTAPIMAVVNRENGFGDYYFGGSSDNEFTITIPTTISSITTSVLDPKMRPARLDEDSCIIYKITKQMNNNLNVLETLNKQQLNKIGL
tara:strand:+ start:2434 stop:5940 length:3507 start_codon:yes stop_codon:yes gene_type:complete